MVRGYRAESKLSYGGRYVIVDSNSGDVLDDAQGYGYKTKTKAYAAYGYKKKHGM